MLKKISGKKLTELSITNWGFIQLVLHFGDVVREKLFVKHCNKMIDKKRNHAVSFWGC